MATNDHTIAVTPDESAPHSPYKRQTTTPRSSRDDSIGCVAATLLASGGLILLAMCVSNVCFGISGVVFLAEEYNHIPDCASNFKGWGISMTVLCLMAAETNRKSLSSDSSKSDTSMRAFGWALIIMSVIPGLVAGLGNRDVLKAHDGCDRSGITQLITWTEWIVVYNVVLFALMIIGGGVLASSKE